VISAPEHRRVLDVIPGRSKQAVQHWLNTLPTEVARNIRVVSIDPYDAYRRAVHAALPHAVFVCDLFHLVRGAGTTMDLVRRDRQRVARATGRLAHGARQSGKQHNWRPELYRSTVGAGTDSPLTESERAIANLVWLPGNDFSVVFLSVG
jgi:transposase